MPEADKEGERYQADKPVLLSEASLLCYQSNPQCGPRFFGAQAGYLARVYARAWANRLLGAIWYTLEGPGWEKGGLLDENQQPRPAYQTLSFMAGLLQGASYDGPRTNGPIEGYAFRKSTTRYELYWTNDDTPVTTTSITAVRLSTRSIQSASNIPEVIHGTRSTVVEWPR